MVRLFWKWPGFFIFSIMNACAGTIRGLGKSTTSALITFFGTCVFRIIWVYTVFSHFKNLESIYISYPISWLITGAFFLVVLFRLSAKGFAKINLHKHQNPSRRLGFHFYVRFVIKMFAFLLADEEILCYNIKKRTSRRTYDERIYLQR